MFAYFLGYSVLEITGYAPGRFLNLCKVNQIHIWNVTVINDGFRLCFLWSDVKKISSFLEKTGTKAVLIQNIGLPFLLQKHVIHSFFFIGILLCICMLYYLSSYVWKIEIHGNQYITEEVMLHFLSENNITYGSKKNDIDCDALEKLLKDNFEVITWVSCSVHGSSFTIQVTENALDLSMEEVAYENQTDLVAAKEGDIISMITRSGEPLVKVGDHVYLGDILVSSNIEILNDDLTVKEVKTVKPDADIVMETMVPYYDSVTIEQKRKQYEGSTKKAYYICVFDHYFPLPGSFRPDKDGKKYYDLKETYENIKLFDVIVLPIKILRRTYEPYTVHCYKMGTKEGKEKLEYNLNTFCETLKEKGIQIVKKDVRIEKNEKEYGLQGKIVIWQYFSTNSTTTIKGENH